MSDDPKELPNKVGYGRPPVGSQYPKGTSGHPGRKPGSKNKPKKLPALSESEQIAWEEANRIVSTTSGDMEAVRAANRAQIKTAVQGGTNAQKALLARNDKIAQKIEDNVTAQLALGEDYVRRCEELLDRVPPEKRAWLEKSMLPHPDDVEVDFQKREVRILGPATVLERREWNRLLNDLEDIRAELLVQREELERDPTSVANQWWYMYKLDRYLTCCEALPERHRPGRLPEWEAGKTIKFWYEDPAHWQNQPKRRPLVKNAALLEQ